MHTGFDATLGYSLHEIYEGGAWHIDVPCIVRVVGKPKLEYRPEINLATMDTDGNWRIVLVETVEIVDSAAYPKGTRLHLVSFASSWEISGGKNDDKTDFPGRALKSKQNYYALLMRPSAGLLPQPSEFTKGTYVRNDYIPSDASDELALLVAFPTSNRSLRTGADLDDALFNNLIDVFLESRGITRASFFLGILGLKVEDPPYREAEKDRVLFWSSSSKPQVSNRWSDYILRLAKQTDDKVLAVRLFGLLADMNIAGSFLKMEAALYPLADGDASECYSLGLPVNQYGHGELIDQYVFDNSIPSYRTPFFASSGVDPAREKQIILHGKNGYVRSFLLMYGQAVTKDNLLDFLPLLDTFPDPNTLPPREQQHMWFNGIWPLDWLLQKFAEAAGEKDKFVDRSQEPRLQSARRAELIAYWKQRYAPKQSP